MSQEEKIGRRAWIKIFTEEWLSGSLRFENTPAERGLWIDILTLAGRSRNPGMIQSNPTTPYPIWRLASMLEISSNFLKETLEKFEKQGRIKQNDTGIEVLNFGYYQDILGTKSKKQQIKSKEKTPQAPQDPQDPDFSELVKIYEGNIGVLSPVIGDELKEVYKIYKKDYIAYAIEEAARANKKNWRYIEGILVGLENEYGDVCKK